MPERPSPSSDFATLARERALRRHREGQASLRSLPTAVAATALLLGFAAIPLIPGAARFLPTPFWAGAVWLAVFLPLMWTLVVLHRLQGYSRLFAWLDHAETAVFAYGCALLAAAGGSLASFWSLPLFALAAYAGAADGTLFFRLQGFVFATAALPAGIALAIQQRSGVPVVEAVALGGMAFLLYAVTGRTTMRAGALEAERDALRERMLAMELTLERGRIADELHDGLGAQLVSIALLSEAGITDHPRAESLLRDLSDRARRAIDEVRAAVWAARPESAPWPAFVEQLRAAANDVCQVRGVNFVLDVAGEQALTIAQRHHLLRVLQEAVHNAVRHAHPGSVHAAIEAHANGLRLEIIDDGPGIPADAASAGRGLSSLRRRAQALGGTLQVGPGSRIRVDVPPGGGAPGSRFPAA